jgi:hypothetical protein
MLKNGNRHGRMMPGVMLFPDVILFFSLISIKYFNFIFTINYYFKV